LLSDSSIFRESFAREGFGFLTQSVTVPVHVGTLTGFGKLVVVVFDIFLGEIRQIQNGLPVVGR
jgi:hypothetical protein